MVIGVGYRGMGGTLTPVMGLGDDRVRFEWSTDVEPPVFLSIALTVNDRMYICLRYGNPDEFDIYRLT